MQTNIFRSLTNLDCENCRINLNGDLFHTTRNDWLKPQFSPINLNAKPRYKIRDSRGNRFHILVEDAVAFTFWDIENPIGPFKNRILEVKEFMSLSVNDKRFIKNPAKNEATYLVTKHGDVWNNFSKRKSSVYLSKQGYCEITIYGYTALVHRLVAMHWIPIPQELIEQGHSFKTLTVNHKNGREKTNNSIYNLEWMTRSQNTTDSYEQNLQKKGRSHPDEQIHAVCEDLQKGMRPKLVAEKHDMNIHSLRDILYRRSRCDIANRYVFPRFQNISPPI